MAARIRSLHPRAPQDEDFASMPFEARLLWTFLPCFADRQGRLEDRPLALKGHVFPTDAVNVEEMLVAFDSRGWIIRYQANGKKLIQIVSFHGYQRPDHHERESVLQPPEGWTGDKGGKYATATPGQRPGKPTPNGGESAECPGNPPGDAGSKSECQGVAAPVIRSSGDPVSEKISPPAGARDPGTAEPESVPPARPGPTHRMTGHQLVVLFGQVRSRVFPHTLAWHTARDTRGDAASFAALLQPEEIADVEPSMQLALEHIRDGVAGWNREQHAKDPSFAFGAWKSGFHGLREELRGRSPPVADARANRREKSAEVLANWRPRDEREAG